MSTSQKRLITKAEPTLAYVRSAEASSYTNEEGTLLTYECQVSGLKSKGSLQPQIDALWKTFLSATKALISDLSSNETTGQRIDILNDTLTGPQPMDASPTSVKKCQVHGCERFPYYPWLECLHHGVQAINERKQQDLVFSRTDDRNTAKQLSSF